MLNLLDRVGAEPTQKYLGDDARRRYEGDEDDEWVRSFRDPPRAIAPRGGGMVAVGGGWRGMLWLGGGPRLALLHTRTSPIGSRPQNSFRRSIPEYNEATCSA